MKATLSPSFYIISLRLWLSRLKRVDFSHCPCTRMLQSSPAPLLLPSQTRLFLQRLRLRSWANIDHLSFRRHLNTPSRRRAEFRGGEDHPSRCKVAELSVPSRNNPYFKRPHQTKGKGFIGTESVNRKSRLSAVE